MKVHDVVKVIRGRHAGAVGVVVAVRDGTKMARVEVDGVRDGAPYSLSQWFSWSSLGANRGN